MKTIEEIKEIIARKVAGQGNQIDLGGGVNEALNAICEVLENVPKTRVLEVLGTTEAAVPISEVLQKLELDGKTPTYDDMVALNPEKDNIVISYPTYTGVDKYTITSFHATSRNLIIAASAFFIDGDAISTSNSLDILLQLKGSSHILMTEA